ncbi:hypothetical protein ACLB1Q_36960 [Escherichia coli]
MAAQKVLTAGGSPWMNCSVLVRPAGLCINFYEDLMNNQKIPDNGALTEELKEQIAGQLKQVGQ